MSDDNDDKGGGDDALKKVLAKNDELLNELKSTRQKLREFEASEADRKAELAKREEEEARKAGDFEKLLKAEATKREEQEGNALLWKSKYQERELDMGLTQQLTAAGVKPELMKAAMALLRNDADLSDDGQISLGGKALPDAIKDWASSDEGKAFVANGNAGSGAEGSGKGKQPAQKAGNLGGSKSDRVAAIKSRFPDLPER